MSEVQHKWPAGWTFPTISSRKEHWWAAGDIRSGCGRYARFLTTPVKDTPPDRKDRCASCERKAQDNR